ncbi:MAG: beta-propeller fold lactonase family protein [Thermoplasmata archaeon]|nr:beta-propeller fold lactonase family protein [Thermoplasmata archaeon]
MTRSRTLAIATAAALLMVIVPTLAQAHATGPNPALSSGSSHGAPLSAAFTMTNNATSNAVVAYRIGAGGALIPAGSFATHGKGTGSSLADQGALALTSNHKWLLVVDAGSDQISVFRVNHPSPAHDLLTFWDRVGSGGITPVSLAIHGSLVYALNVGNTTTAGDIAGFYLTGTGLLLPLPGSHRALSAATPTGAAQISFNPAGDLLAVTEKATNLIDTFVVGDRGYAHGPLATSSNGTTPYGFAFTPNGHLVVSDAGPGALSSYAVTTAGALSVVSGTALDNQSAPCWVVVADDGQYAYTTNAHSDSISIYHVAHNGTLLLTASVGGSTGKGPTDLASTTSNDRYLLVYDSGAGEIDEFSLGTAGALSEVASVYGLPSTAEGLVAF